MNQSFAAFFAVAQWCKLFQDRSVCTFPAMPARFCFELLFEHFLKLCRPENHCYPTHSAEKAEWMGVNTEIVLHWGDVEGRGGKRWD
jgi:hypothetical protein